MENLSHVKATLMIPWTIHQQEPVIAPGVLHPGLDDCRAGAGHVIEARNKFRMVYWGTDRQGRHTILQAESPINDPNRWQPHGDALLGPQPDKVQNCHGPGFPFLLPVTESHWLLYFVAWGERSDGKLPNTTGVAVSDDRGHTWRYHTEHPIIALDRPYDAEASGSVWVLHENDRFRMYYTAIGRYFPAPEGAETGHGDKIPEIGIGYAESRDGLHWEKPLDHLVVAPRAFGVTPYEYICSKPCVIKEQNGYVMWVNTFGTAYRVHRLVSNDGLNWQWAKRYGPDGELGVGTNGAFDDEQRSYPSIVSVDGELRCWFTGNRFGATGTGYAVLR